MEPSTQAGWASWTEAERPFTIGIEEEVMLLDPGDWSLDQRFGELRQRLSPELAEQLTTETHGATIEYETEPHPTAAAAGAELTVLRSLLDEELRGQGAAVAGSGTHPFTTWEETELSPDGRYRYIHDTMRELARREPTFAMHVHVAVADPELAIATANRMRVHLPLLLALSANSPFWLGRDSGLASARTPIFWGFPRTGIPRAFDGYDDYVRTLATLIECGAFPGPSYVWWDLRLRPSYGTIEIRVMDTQAEVERTTALAALTQSLVRMEALEPRAPGELVDAPELLEENGFRAARDGVRAELLDPREHCAYAVEALAELAVEACRPHARELGCELELDAVEGLIAEPADTAQREIAAPDDDLALVVEELAARFSRSPRAAAGRSPGRSGDPLRSR
jgi:glutamate---cysteine ligase / carboxylate-amine ligase